MSSMCLVFDPEISSLFYSLSPTCTLLSFLLLRSENKLILIWDDQSGTVKVFLWSQLHLLPWKQTCLYLHPFFVLSPPVDVHRASRPLPDDVWRSGPIGWRSRGRSGQRRWPIINTWQQLLCFVLHLLNNNSLEQFLIAVHNALSGG